jgi:hypothetical protein
MSWINNPVCLDESGWFVSLLCHNPGLIGSLILIPKSGRSELQYDVIIAYQYYFEKTKNFLMGLF